MNVLQCLALFSVLTTVHGWLFLWACPWGCVRRRGLEKTKCDGGEKIRCSLTFKEKKFMTCLDMCADKKDKTPDGGHLMAMNPNYNFYDIHSKGCFDFNDFCISVGIGQEDPNMKKAFDLTNTNNDDCIDPKEFVNAGVFMFPQDESLASETGDVVKYNEEDRGLWEKVLEDEAHDAETTRRENTEDVDLSETIRAIKRMLYQNRY